MYIDEKYWNNYIGDTDDSLTLLEYLADKNKAEIALGEIFSDIGLDRLGGDFRQHEEPLTFTLANTGADSGAEMEFYVEFYYAIDVLADLAALLLECGKSGSVDLCELYGDEMDTDTPEIRITATPEEYALVDRVLADFAADPLAYDLSEMVGEEDMREIAAVCAALREELAALS